MKIAILKILKTHTLSVKQPTFKLKNVHTTIYKSERNAKREKLFAIEGLEC